MKNSRLPILVLIVYLILSIVNHGIILGSAEPARRLHVLTYHSISSSSEGLYVMEAEPYRWDAKCPKRWLRNL